MKNEENLFFMGEVQRIILDALKKQAFSILLMCCACYYFWSQNQVLDTRLQTQYETSMRRQEAFVEQVNGLKMDVYECSQEKNRLQNEINVLRIEFRTFKRK